MDLEKDINFSGVGKGVLGVRNSLSYGSLRDDENDDGKKDTENPLYEDEAEDIVAGKEGEDGVGRGDLERVASTQPSVRDVNAIPDGGMRAWSQVVGSFFLFWNSWWVPFLFFSLVKLRP